MNVGNISQVNFTANKVMIMRNVAENCHKNRPLLNNEVVDLIKGKGMTTVFNNTGIEVSNPTREFLDALIEKGIKFFNT